jgi:hypothetical protein
MLVVKRRCSATRSVRSEGAGVRPYEYSMTLATRYERERQGTLSGAYR